MATIIIKDEQELQQKFIELVHAVHNMRFAQKYWHQHYGHQAREKMKRWETKVDGQLNLLGLSEHQNLSAIKIIPLDKQ